MTVRVTQEYVEVLMEGDGNVFLTQFYIEVIVNTVHPCSNDLTMSVEATATNVNYNRSVASDLTMSSTATPTFRNNCPAITGDFDITQIATVVFINAVQAESEAPEFIATAVATFRNNVPAESQLSPLAFAEATFRTFCPASTLFNTLSATASVEYLSPDSISTLEMDALAVSNFRTTNEAENTLDGLQANAECPFRTSHVLSSDLIFTPVATAGHYAPLQPAIVHNLTLSVIAGVFRSTPVEAENTLTFTDLAERGIYYRTLAHNLTLSTSAIVFRSTSVSAISTLAFDQLATSNQKFPQATSTLTFGQTIAVIRPWYLSVTTPLVETTTQFDYDTFSMITVILSGLDSTATVASFQTTQNVQSWLDLNSQNANGYILRADAIAADADNTLSMSVEAIVNQTADASNTLAMTASASAQTGIPAEVNLALDSVASALLSRSVSASSTITITETVRFKTSSPDLCNYEPLIGSTTDPDAPTPPPSTLPAASELTGFRLIFPSTSMATDELVLRAPNLGDLNRLAFDRINRETRGGTLVIFADTIWPKVETLVLQFSVLTKEEAYALLTFMDAHLGQEIRLIDWEHRAWKGVITNPQDPIVEDRRNSFTASFEFEGARET